MIIQVFCFVLVEIASGNEKGFLESDGMGELAKEANPPGFGSAVIKSTEAAKDN